VSWLLNVLRASAGSPVAEVCCIAQQPDTRPLRAQAVDSVQLPNGPPTRPEIPPPQDVQPPPHPNHFLTRTVTTTTPTRRPTPAPKADSHTSRNLPAGLLKQSQLTVRGCWQHSIQPRAVSEGTCSLTKKPISFAQSTPGFNEALHRPRVHYWSLYPPQNSRAASSKSRWSKVAWKISR